MNEEDFVGCGSSATDSNNGSDVEEEDVHNVLVIELVLVLTCVVRHS
jgi:hypothetical protein